MSDTTLHTLNQGPSRKDLLDCCKRLISKEDTLLLIEDGIYWALPIYQQQLAELGCDIKVLRVDAQARGVVCDHCISDDEFVALSIQHARSVSWF